MTQSRAGVARSALARSPGSSRGTSGSLWRMLSRTRLSDHPRAPVNPFYPLLSCAVRRRGNSRSCVSLPLARTTATPYQLTAHAHPFDLPRSPPCSRIRPEQVPTASCWRPTAVSNRTCSVQIGRRQPPQPSPAALRTPSGRTKKKPPPKSPLGPSAVYAIQLP